MANHCNYALMIKGQTKDVEEMVKIIQMDDYEAGPHLHRVFDATVTDTKDLGDDIITVTIDGYCAWSVYSCMFEGPHTYHTSSPSEYSTTIPKESQRLNLDIEIFSAEPGVGFSEHYFVSAGEIVIDDTDEDYSEFYPDDYESVDEFNAETGLNISKAQFETEECIVSGGHGEWMFDNI